MPSPYKLFTIYAREDAQYLSELLGQLRPLEMAGRIKVWSDREINPGVEWEKEIVQQPATRDTSLSSTVYRPPSTVPFNYPMVSVAGGTFTMGSPSREGSRNDNECQHSVTVNSFSMGQYEVTQAQWKAVMGSNPSGHIGCADCPVENVSWDDVQAFIKRLNIATGKHYRLPSEAEWEYAARGGVKTRYYPYAGSNTPGSVAWYKNNSGSETHPVGSKLPNELGLYDMSGNVWEWCQDVYQAYPSDNHTDGNGQDRVNRGGSAFNPAPNCRVACRNYLHPAYPTVTLGFRLALSLR